jgi:alpha-galactosidase
VNKTLSWGTPTFALTFGWDDDQPVRLTGFSGEDSGVVITHPLPIIEVLTASTGRLAASNRLPHTAIGADLRYLSHEVQDLPDRKRLKIITRALRSNLQASANFEIFHGANAVRSHVCVLNTGDGNQVLFALPSLTFGLPSTTDSMVEDPFSAWRLISGVSDWLGEGRWGSSALRGPNFPTLSERLTGHNPRGAASVTSSGTWSTGSHLPVAGLESDAFQTALAWQVEHNGPWRWEIGEDTAGGYVSMSGPTDIDSAWSKVLPPCGSFTSVPATLSFGQDFTAAVGELTKFRRAARRKHSDNTSMRVVYNDYMNTIDGDPTTEKLLPLVRAAAAVGAEIFCVDAGWFDDTGHWWDGVGEWLPSTTRFPNGLGEVIDAITNAGMAPGLWLEPEVVGIHSPLANTLPPEAFLQRRGSRIVEHDRFHLDLRHPAAIEHLDTAVDRLVSDFGIEFFKFDYNINPGAGTDYNTDSVGDGLLGHNRAHLDWLDKLLDRHPGLVIENCSSGAMRADFALLSRLAMQSTSDQQDFLKFPAIAAAAPLSMLPEQAANWAYPQPEMTDEEVAFCLATGLLGRFYLSGYLNQMDSPALELVREATALSKELRPLIRSGLPYWPKGLPGWDDKWLGLGLRNSAVDLLTVWNREAVDDLVLQLPHFSGQEIVMETLFPANLPSWKTSWDQANGQLTIQSTGDLSARVFRIISDMNLNHPHPRAVRG